MMTPVSKVDAATMEPVLTLVVKMPIVQAVRFVMPMVNALSRAFVLMMLAAVRVAFVKMRYVLIIALRRAVQANLAVMNNRVHARKPIRADVTPNV